MAELDAKREVLMKQAQEAARTVEKARLEQEKAAEDAKQA